MNGDPKGTFKLKNDGKTSHIVRVFEDFVFVTNNYLNITIGKPDQETAKDFETYIYIGDHAIINVKGSLRGIVTLQIKSDEYPTNLIIDDDEKNFSVDLKMRREA